MNLILKGLLGVLCLINDIFIWRSGQTEHNARLLATLKGLEEAGVTLNSDKCAINQRSVKFLGYMITSVWKLFYYSPKKYMH